MPEQREGAALHPHRGIDEGGKSRANANLFIRTRLARRRRSNRSKLLLFSFSCIYRAMAAHDRPRVASPSRASVGTATPGGGAAHCPTSIPSSPMLVAPSPALHLPLAGTDPRPSAHERKDHQSPRRRAGLDPSASPRGDQRTPAAHGTVPAAAPYEDGWPGVVGGRGKKRHHHDTARSAVQRAIPTFRCATPRLAPRDIVAGVPRAGRRATSLPPTSGPPPPPTRRSPPMGASPRPPTGPRPAPARSPGEGAGPLLQAPGRPGAAGDRDPPGPGRRGERLGDRRRTGPPLPVVSHQLALLRAAGAVEGRREASASSAASGPRTSTGCSAPPCRAAAQSGRGPPGGVPPQPRGGLRGATARSVGPRSAAGPCRRIPNHATDNPASISYQRLHRVAILGSRTGAPGRRRQFAVDGPLHGTVIMSHADHLAFASRSARSARKTMANPGSRDLRRPWGSPPAPGRITRRA